ncbi:MAG: TraB/GumN family protein, partial [Gammaproteobacteria bacterium]
MMPKSATGLFLDRVLYLEALAKGKPVTGLETAEEQMAVFTALSDEAQTRLLEDALRQLPELDELHARMRAAYVRRDLQALIDISEASLRDSDPELAAYFNEQVIVARNRRMVERMQADLKRGNAFIAVGALHLPGEEGILALLRRQGYRVSVVY